MYVKKNFGLLSILRFSGAHLIWISLWAILVTLIYEYTTIGEWMVIPWLPLSVIGTAVAFMWVSKTIVPTTVYGKQEKYGVLLLTEVVHGGASSKAL